MEFASFPLCHSQCFVLLSLCSALTVSLCFERVCEALEHKHTGEADW